jgi:hypothetical protein
MFLALDFEWWEKSEDVILEVGWSLWDSLTQQHRTRHWVVQEHLNKVRRQPEVSWFGQKLKYLLWQSNALHPAAGTCREDACAGLQQCAAPMPRTTASSQLLVTHCVHVLVTRPHPLVLCLRVCCFLQANGRFISDNRMRFLFSSSERGSLDSAMNALQADVDAAGISEGLDRQQVGGTCVCGCACYE